MSEEPSHDFEAYLNDFQGDLASGNYSMWWTTPEDPKFSDSPLRKIIHESFEALDGIEPFVAMLILEKLKKEQIDSLIELPEELGTEYIYKAGLPPLILSLNREKSIRLHFNEHLFSAQQRYEIYFSFCDYLKLIKRATNRENKKTPIQRLQRVFQKIPAQDKGLNWWKTVDQLSTRYGAERIGSISIDS